MITRIIVVDPKNPNNLVVYQVPERSRAFEILIETFNTANLEWAELKSKQPGKRGVSPLCVCGHKKVRHHKGKDVCLKPECACLVFQQQEG